VAAAAGVVSAWSAEGSEWIGAVAGPASIAAGMLAGSMTLTVAAGCCAAEVAEAARISARTPLRARTTTVADTRAARTNPVLRVDMSKYSFGVGGNAGLCAGDPLRRPVCDWPAEQLRSWI
jgi:hypothetical protein